MTDSANKASNFIRDLGDAARQNPVSAALIGMGVLWLFAGGARRAGFDGTTASDAVAEGRSAMQTGWQSAGNGVSDLADSLGRRARRAGAASGDAIYSAANTLRRRGGALYEQTSRLGSEFAESASDLTRSVPDSASSAVDTARSNLATLFREQPLLLGAIGVAIGAGIAASLPPTELETEYFGEASDRLKDKVQEFASDQAQQAKAVAEEAAQAAAGEARRQGLDPGALKSAVADAGARVRNVAGAATDSIKQRANQG